jgi:hypothetical protein
VKTEIFQRSGPIWVSLQRARLKRHLGGDPIVSLRIKAFGELLPFEPVIPAGQWDPSRDAFGPVIVPLLRFPPSGDCSQSSARLRCGIHRSEGLLRYRLVIRFGISSFSRDCSPSRLSTPVRKVNPFRRSPIRMSYPVWESSINGDRSPLILYPGSGRLIRSGERPFRGFKSRSESLSRQRIAPCRGLDLGWGYESRTQDHLFRGDISRLRIESGKGLLPFRFIISIGK